MGLRSHFRSLRVFVVALLLMIPLTGILSGQAFVVNGGNWLMTEQDTSGGSLDGGFPWTSGGTIFSNTQGATALGMVRAYERTGNASFLNSAVEAGDFIVGGYGGLSSGTWTNGDPRFATHDLLFLEALSVASGDNQYSNYAQTWFWDKLATSSYGNSNLDAAGYGSGVVTNRTGQGLVELAPWDLSKTAIAAHEAGETSIRDDLMDNILTALESTTVGDTDFDLHGLAGGIWASIVTGEDLDPTAGRYASSDSTQDLIDELLNYQSVNGGFVFNSTADVNDGSNASTQVTAFALLALNAADPVTYASEIDDALTYLANVQQGDGQILVAPGASPTSAGGVEVHGEALEAYSVSIPEPSALIVFPLVGAVAVLRRRNRKN